MKFKVSPLALTIVLAVVLGAVVANFLAVPSLAADAASCSSGECNCSCSGPAGCACASKAGACLCECSGMAPDFCLPHIFIP